MYLYREKSTRSRVVAYVRKHMEREGVVVEPVARWLVPPRHALKVTYNDKLAHGYRLNCVIRLFH